MIGFYAAGAMGLGGSGGDPHWSSVASLLHFDGTDGSTTFTDQTGKTWTVNGNTQIDTDQYKFGGASGLFDGVDDDLSHASHTDFGVGTGDFTWEAWVRRQNGNCVIFDNRSSGADTASIVCFIAFDGLISYYDTTTKSGVGPAGFVPLSAWTHVAWCRHSGTIRMFVSGVQVFSGSKITHMGAERPMLIGRDVVGGADFSGHIDDVRITNGVARYTTGFTPPNAAFPDL